MRPGINQTSPQVAVVRCIWAQLKDCTLHRSYESSSHTGRPPALSTAESPLGCLRSAPRPATGREGASARRADPPGRLGRPPGGDREAGWAREAAVSGKDTRTGGQPEGGERESSRGPVSGRARAYQGAAGTTRAEREEYRAGEGESSGATRGRERAIREWWNASGGASRVMREECARCVRAQAAHRLPERVSDPACGRFRMSALPYECTRVRTSARASARVHALPYECTRFRTSARASVRVHALPYECTRARTISRAAEPSSRLRGRGAIYTDKR
jgi:hypothetical protein